MLQNSTKISKITLPYSIIINEKPKEIIKVYNKEVYWEIVSANVKEPTSINNWVDLFPFLESIDWKSVFTLAYKICKEPYLQTFQYKVLNRTINCQYNLFKWHISVSSKCSYCVSIDTIEHHLYYCPISLKFWNEVSLWLYDITKVKLNLTICEIIFGISLNLHNQSDVLIMFNYIILLGKWYINHCRPHQKQIDVLEFTLILKNKLKILKMLHTLSNNADAFSNIFGILYDKLKSLV